MHNKSMAAAVFLLAAGFAFPAHAQEKLTQAQCLEEVMRDLARQGIDARSIPIGTRVTVDTMPYDFFGGMTPEDICRVALPHIEERHKLKQQLVLERRLVKTAQGERKKAVKALESFQKDSFVRNAHLIAFVAVILAFLLSVKILWKILRFLLRTLLKRRRRGPRFGSLSGSRGHSTFSLL